MKPSLKKSLIILIILVISIIIVHYYFKDYLTLSQLQRNRNILLSYVESRYSSAVIIYVLSYILVITLSIPGVAPLTLLGGFLFGVIPAVFYSLIGCTVGSLLFFFGVRYVFKVMLQKRWEKNLYVFNNQMQLHGSSYLLTLQLLTVFPYFFINTLAALTDVSWIVFLWTTMVGALPLLTVYALAGRQLAVISSVRDIFSPQIIILLILLALCACIPIVIRRMRGYEWE